MPELPPGPRLPRAVQTAVWIRGAQWMLDQCHRRFGDTFSLRIAHQGTWVVLTDPADVQRVFTGDPNVLYAGEGNRILEPVLGSRSVLLLDGPDHLEQRKLMLPAFHGERMKRYGDVMAQIAIEEIERWPRGQIQRLRPRMQAITLEIVLRAVFGVTDPDRLADLRFALRRLLNMVTEPRRVAVMIALGPARMGQFPPFRRDRDRVDRLLYAEIATRRTTDLAARTDIMSLLLAARREDGSPMSDRDLRDELLTLLVAGHETTANALAWACERLARHPEKLRRLADEARAGSDTYLTAVVQETLRLRPVISIVNRVLKAPMRFAGYDLPAGVAVVPCIYLVHRRPDVYPNPHAFEPERFLDRPPGTYTWIPFGGGVRRCLGAAFAQFEMEVVLRELALRTVIRPTRPHAEPVLRRAVTETPRHDAEVIVG
ncbi:MAG: cytochrome P450 [Solirubrobacteraceae bacterium]